MYLLTASTQHQTSVLGVFASEALAMQYLSKFAKVAASGQLEISCKLLNIQPVATGFPVYVCCKYTQGALTLLRAYSSVSQAIAGLSVMQPLAGDNSKVILLALPANQGSANPENMEFWGELQETA